MSLSFLLDPLFLSICTSKTMYISYSYLKHSTPITQSIQQQDSITVNISVPSLMIKNSLSNCTNLVHLGSLFFFYYQLNISIISTLMYLFKEITRH